jgi:hypothetical protein
MAGGEFGRPIIAPPGVPPDRTRILRDAFMTTMNYPELIVRQKPIIWISFRVAAKISMFWRRMSLRSRGMRPVIEEIDQPVDKIILCALALAS